MSTGLDLTPAPLRVSADASDRERRLRRLRDALYDAERGRSDLCSLATSALRWALTELDPSNAALSSRARPSSRP